VNRKLKEFTKSKLTRGIHVKSSYRYDENNHRNQ